MRRSFGRGDLGDGRNLASKHSRSPGHEKLPKCFTTTIDVQLGIISSRVVLYLNREKKKNELHIHGSEAPLRKLFLNFAVEADHRLWERL
jgi:hypothetical protein